MGSDSKTLDDNSIAYMLGQVGEYCTSGDLDKAKSICLEILSSNPCHADTLHYLALIEFHTGQAEIALQHIGAAISYKPEDHRFHYNKGNILYKIGRTTEAGPAFKEAARLNPQDPMARAAYATYCNNLAANASRQSNCALAKSLFEEALQLDPENSTTLLNYAWFLSDEGRTEEAARNYETILNMSPLPGVQIRLATLLPAISFSLDHIQSARREFRDRVIELLESDIRIENPAAEVGTVNFLLAYHGLNNRDLQVLVARLHIKACPELQYTAPHCRTPVTRDADDKIRIGFISKYFHNHSIGNTTRGLIEKLSRSKFNVTVFVFSEPKDSTGRLIKKHCDSYIVLEKNLITVRQTISEHKLDILMYPDIGMDPFTYFLAFSRLAPVQATSFGHPDTTGIPNLDYFISTECYESDEGDDHYSEQLVRLTDSTSLAYYYRPPLPEPLKPRTFFGLDNNNHIYICPQQLFKFHPDFDEVISGILEDDPEGIVVIIEGKHPHWGELLRQRFQNTIPTVTDRIRFVHRLTTPDFINLIAVSDVMLDTLHFCGQNTTHEGLSAGTPIVSMPGKLQRSRHTMCFLKVIGLDECIAQNRKDYIRIAVKIGTDQAYRNSLREIIRKNAHRIWEDETVVKEHEEFFEKALDSALGST